MDKFHNNLPCVGMLRASLTSLRSNSEGGGGTAQMQVKKVQETKRRKKVVCFKIFRFIIGKDKAGIN